MIIKLENEDGSTTILKADLEQWFEERRIFFEAGIFAALHDALYVCRNTKCEIPDWVWDKTTQMIKQQMQEGEATGMGAKGNSAHAIKKDYDHLRRWLAVKKLQKAGFPEAVKKTFTEAKKLLSDVNAVTTWEAIRYSYKKVEKDIQDPILAKQYYVPLQGTRLALDLKPILKGVTFLKG